jgi:alpha-beta hydrolase superfamily lysophospholipase
MDLPENFREERILSNYDDLELSILISLPKIIEGKAIVQIEHGMAEHKERYIPFMDYLSGLGYVCVCHDHRGHGKSVKSEDDLGYMFSGGYEAMIDDSRLVLNYVRSMFPNTKSILLGHSMGSFIARSLVKRNDSNIDGLILTGSPSYNPAIGLVRAFSLLVSKIRGERYRSDLLNWFVFGIYSLKIKDNSSKYSWICTDIDVVKGYEADDLCGFVFTANGFVNLFSLMMDVYNTKNWKMAKPILPVCFLSGENDPCHDGKKSFYRSVGFMERVGYNDVKSKLYSGMRHEILNEKDKKIVWNDIAESLEMF